MAERRSKADAPHQTTSAKTDWRSALIELGDDLFSVALDGLLLRDERRLLLHDGAHPHFGENTGYAPRRDLKVSDTEILEAADVVHALGIGAVHHDVKGFLLASVLLAIAVQLRDGSCDLILVVNDAHPAVAQARRTLQRRCRRAADIIRKTCVMKTD